MRQDNRVRVRGGKPGSITLTAIRSEQCYERDPQTVMAAQRRRHWTHPKAPGKAIHENTAGWGGLEKRPVSQARGEKGIQEHQAKINKTAKKPFEDSDDMAR